MKIIICGSRTFENMLTIEDVEEAVKKSKFKITEVVSGECKHDNSLAHAYADYREIPIREFVISWDDITYCQSPKMNKSGKLYNPRAAFERNERMIKYSDALIYFFQENSLDSESIVSCAKKLSLPVFFAKPNPEYIF